MMIIHFFILLISLSSFSINAQRNVVLPSDEKIYSEAVKLTESILKRCPPKDCVPIFFGRSPAIIMATLDNLNLEYSAVPLSGFRFYPGKEAPWGGDQSLDDEKVDKLYNHFDRYVLSEKNLAGRKIMAIDFSVSGISLIGSSTYLKQYLVNRKRVDRLYSLHLFTRPFDEGTYRQINMQLYPHLNKALLRQDLEDFAPYGSFYITNATKDASKNVGYQSLVEKMKSFLSISHPSCEVVVKSILR